MEDSKEDMDCLGSEMDGCVEEDEGDKVGGLGATE